MQRNCRGIRNVKAGKCLGRTDAADSRAGLPRQLPKPFALSAQHESHRTRERSVFEQRITLAIEPNHCDTGGLEFLKRARQVLHQCNRDEFQCARC